MDGITSLGIFAATESCDGITESPASVTVMSYGWLLGSSEGTSSTGGNSGMISLCCEDDEGGVGG